MPTTYQELLVQRKYDKERITELEAEVERLKIYKDLKDYMGLPDEELFKQIMQLRSALEKYGMHQSGCCVLDNTLNPICCCGLEQALEPDS